MRRLIILTFVLVAALPLWSTNAASPAIMHRNGGAPLTFACAPAQPILQHKPLQRFFSYAVAPGSSLGDSLAVLNLSYTSPLTVNIGTSDAQTPPLGGGMAYNDSGRQRAVGLWLHAATTSVGVAPRRYAVVPLYMQVPSSVRPGEYEGAVDVTSLQPIVVTKGRSKVLVHVTERCQVVLRVTGQASAGFQIQRTSIVSSKQGPILAVTFKNTGTVTDRPVTAVVTFAGSNKTYSLHPHISPVMGSATTTMGWAIARAIPPGAYKVRIDISYQANTVYGSPPQLLRVGWSGALTVPTER